MDLSPSSTSALITSEKLCGCFAFIFGAHTHARARARSASGAAPLSPENLVLVLCYGPAAWHIHISLWLIIIPCDHSAPPWPPGAGPRLFSNIICYRGRESKDAALFSFPPPRLLQTLLPPPRSSRFILRLPQRPSPPVSLINGTQLK